MKILGFICFIIGVQVLASEPPAGYPVVKGVIRKVDHASMRLSIKHEDIPNLDMPGMTMSFVVTDHSQMAGLKVDDKIKFVADEVDGEITVLWIQKESANELPYVKGIVRKIDLNAARISIKHEDIPNLDMPGMTMSFLVKEPSSLKGLAVGDSISFTVTEVDGELVVMSLKKNKPGIIGVASLFCTGTGNTTPKTKVEIEIRPESFSTIRFEHIEGSYIGSSHSSSIGHLKLFKNGEQLEYRAGLGNLDSKLSFKIKNQEILDAKFTNFTANMKNEPVSCNFE